MIEVRHPAQVFQDTDGTPLDAGYIYIGPTGTNPETTPQAVYWDKAGLIPAAQPIRTVNGYPSRDGAAAKFYTSTKNYSITVKDKRGILVIGTLNNDSGVFDELMDESAMAGIGYDNTASGLTATNGQAAIDELDAALNVAQADITNLRSSFSGMVNLFANSAFLINQRNYVSGTVTTVANQYTLDRLRVVVLGESLIVASGDFGNKITAPAGGAEQVIEGIFITGGDYACTWTGTGTVQVNGVTYAKGETITLVAETNAVVHMVGEFEKFIFTRPDMIGRYEYDYQDDYFLCTRYAERAQITLRGNGYTGFVYAQFTFKATKRIIPTMALISPAYTTASGAGFNSITQNGAELFVSTSAPAGFVSTEYLATAEF